MKMSKKVFLALACISVIGFAIPASASSPPNSPAEILADLTDQSVESIVDQRFESGLTYGALADEYGVLDEFREEMLEAKKAFLQEAVDAGKMTKEEADEIIANIVQAQESCDLYGNNNLCPKEGYGYGFGNGNGRGRGCGRGNGRCF